MALISWMVFFNNLYVLLQFNVQIHNLISNGKKVLVVFKNGAIHELSNVIHQRKKITLEQVVDHNIKDVIYKTFKDNFYIGITVEGDSIFYWSEYNADCVKFSKISLSRDGHTLRGHCFHQDRNKMILLTLCKYFF